MPRISDEKKELARVLLRAGKSYREVAEALDISIGSVHMLSKEPMEALAPLIEEISARHRAKCLIIADHIMGQISDGDILRAGLKEKAIAAAIFTDKARGITRKPDGTLKLNKMNTPEEPQPPDSMENIDDFPPPK